MRSKQVFGSAARFSVPDGAVSNACATTTVASTGQPNAAVGGTSSTLESSSAPRRSSGPLSHRSTSWMHTECTSVDETSKSSDSIPTSTSRTGVSTATTTTIRTCRRDMQDQIGSRSRRASSAVQLRADISSTRYHNYSPASRVQPYVKLTTSTATATTTTTAAASTTTTATQGTFASTSCNSNSNNDNNSNNNNSNNDNVGLTPPLPPPPPALISIQTRNRYSQRRRTVLREEDLVTVPATASRTVTDGGGVMTCKTLTHDCPDVRGSGDGGGGSSESDQATTMQFEVVEHRTDDAAAGAAATTVFVTTDSHNGSLEARMAADGLDDGDQTVVETATTAGTTSSALLMPIMLVGSENPGDNKFDEAQKTVIVHVEQLPSEGTHLSQPHRSLPAIINQQSVIEDQAIHHIGIAVPPQEETDPPSSDVERLGVLSALTDEVLPNHEGDCLQSSSETDGVLLLRQSQSAVEGVTRWYADRSFLDELQCLLCGETMEAVQLAEHLPNVHGYRTPEIGRGAFLKYIRMKKVPIAIMPGRSRMSGREGVGACPECPRTVLKRLDLLTHMYEEHGREFVLFDVEFESAEQFEQWLELITVEFMTGYSKYRTNVNAAGIKSQMYLCRMESKPVCKSTTYKTDRRTRNRAKTAYCTAHLQVRFLDDGRLHVKGSPTHINHPVDLFNAYRSLDDVPFDALPGYVAINTKTPNDVLTKTLELCEKVFGQVQALKELLYMSPAPSDYNITRSLHGKLQSLHGLVCRYRFHAIAIEHQPGDSQELQQPVQQEQISIEEANDIGTIAMLT